MSTPSRRRGRRLDLASIAVAPIGVLVILLAQTVDGASVRSLFQASAALIVFGGTIGAVLVSFRPIEILRALEAAGRAFLTIEDDTSALATKLVAMSIRAHRRGLLALEHDVDNLDDPFFRDAMALAVDDMRADTLREFISTERAAREAEDETPARVFETAAGYAPTMGILGAVLGLIHVMQNLAAPSALGSGIAVAFVATIYGVGSANLVLLPLAGRLRERAAAASRRRELIAQGACAIQQRVNPRLVAQKLRAYAADMPRIEDMTSIGRTQGTRVPA
jgi:chemotaxis protein MotA